MISQPILPAAEPGNVILQPSVTAMSGSAPEEEGNEWWRPAPPYRPRVRVAW